MLCLVSNYYNYGTSGSNTASPIYLLTLTTIIMIYFYKSSRKSDNLQHPIIVCSNNERRAFALALINFKKNNFKGSPILAI